MKLQESLAGSVIQATGAVEFGDDLRTEVLHRGCWCHCDDRINLRINSNQDPLGVWVGPWGSVVVI